MKIKPLTQLRQGGIDKMSQLFEASFFVVKSGLIEFLNKLVNRNYIEAYMVHHKKIRDDIC